MGSKALFWPWTPAPHGFSLKLETPNGILPKAEGLYVQVTAPYP
jgi:hypothetical protein